jgi:hypothetical protein
VNNFNSSLRKIVTVDGQDFARSRREITPTGEAPAEAGKRERERVDERMSMLLEMPTSPLQERLIAERFALNQRIDAVVGKWQQKRRAAMEVEHEKLKAECLDQLSRIDELRAKHGALQTELNHLTSSEGECSAAQQSALGDWRSLSRYSSKKEIAAAQEKLRDAEEKLRQARAKKSPLEDARNEIFLNQLPKEFQRLHELEAQEVRLRATLEGTGYTDPEFGLVLPAGVNI